MEGGGRGKAQRDVKNQRDSICLHSFLPGIPGLQGVPGYQVYRVYQDTRFTGCTRIYQVYRVYTYSRFTGCTQVYQVYRVCQDIYCS